MKIFLLSALLALTVLYSEGQELAREKFVDHYVGLQANQLLKQLINLNNNTTPISNPYLITYSAFSTKCNWGVQTGFGFDYRRTNDKLSPTNQQSKISDAFYRIGVARRFMFGKRWEATAGADFVGSYQLDKTFSSLVTVLNTQQRDSAYTVSSTLVTSKGGGVQFRLAYFITKQISLFTEATFYMSKTENKSSVIVSDTQYFISPPANETYSLAGTNSNTENFSFAITIPVVIYLTIKF